MNLIVFPGGGSPDNELYEKVYGFIKRSAPSYGYKEADISLRWPGHADKGGDVSGKMTSNGAKDIANLKNQEYEDERLEYDILGRSFGTLVAVHIASEKALKGLRKLILWGPAPFWLFWQMFKRDLVINQEKANEGVPR